MNDVSQTEKTASTVPQQREEAGHQIVSVPLPGPLPAPPADPFLGRRITPIARRRIENFKANRRGFWSLWIFLALFGTSLGAEVLANDRPLLVRYDGSLFL